MPRANRKLFHCVISEFIVYPYVLINRIRDNLKCNPYLKTNKCVSHGKHPDYVYKEMSLCDIWTDKFIHEINRIKKAKLKQTPPVSQLLYSIEF